MFHVTIHVWNLYSYVCMSIFVVQLCHLTMWQYSFFACFTHLSCWKPPMGWKYPQVHRKFRKKSILYRFRRTDSCFDNDDIAACMHTMLPQITVWPNTFARNEFCHIVKFIHRSTRIASKHNKSLWDDMTVCKQRLPLVCHLRYLQGDWNTLISHFNKNHYQCSYRLFLVSDVRAMNSKRSLAVRKGNFGMILN